MAETLASLTYTSERGQTGLAHWGVGVSMAIGLHIGAVVMALSSGSGLSLAPEGGGGTGGMTVMMGSAGDGMDSHNEVAAASVIQTVPEPEPVLKAPKPEPKPEVKPIPVAKSKPKPTPKPKPKPKPQPKIKPKAKVAPKSVKTVIQRKVAQGTAQAEKTVKGVAGGRVGATGATNLRAGGGPIGPSVGAGHSNGFGIDTALKSYKREMHRLLMRKKRYPRSAQRLNQEGIVEVSFIVAPSGRISHIKIKSPSRYPSLNRESKNLLKRIGRFPSIPASISTTPMPFTVNIPFHLR